MPERSPSLRRHSYHIRVQGHLATRWSDWFGHFEIRYLGEDTLLTGSVADQAALHGLLAKIRDLGLPLLSIRRIGDEPYSQDGISCE